MKILLGLIAGLFLTNCNDCEVVSGVYGGGMLTVSVNGTDVKGVLDITQGNPKVICYLEFSFEQNNGCDKLIKLTDSFGNEYKGIVELKNNELFIQSLEPLGACQRVIDLKSGETFTLDD